MFGKTTMLVGAAAGYVLGAKAGRERYDQIVDQARRLWRDPKVQDTVSSAQDAAKKQASAVKDKVGSDDNSSGPASGTGPAAAVPPPVAPAPGTVSGTAPGTGPTGTGPASRG